jgi:hypothetical protein
LSRRNHEGALPGAFFVSRIEAAAASSAEEGESDGTPLPFTRARRCGNVGNPVRPADDMREPLRASAETIR